MLHRGTGRRVLMNEGERRARDFRRHAVALADRLHERCLPCSELAGDRDYQGRMSRLAETASPVAKRRLVHGQRPMIGERRHQVRMTVLFGGAAHRAALLSAATFPRETLPPMRAFTSNS